MNTINFGERNSGPQVGVNNGVINLGAEPLEFRPDPLSTVPVPHDPDFVGRDDLLNRIHEQSSVPGSRIVLVGLGGVGKTRLAVEYCHQVRQQSPHTWVFWVHASNAARSEESLRNIAERTKIPGRRDRDANIFQLFGNWLQDGKIGKWILVLDNLDDDELLRKPLATSTDDKANAQNHNSTQPPLKYLLESSEGSIIITSRNKGVALEIAGYMKHLIDVQPMAIDEALVLIQKKLGSGIQRADLVQLVEELEFMPLAIIQAASYITHRSPRCSVSQYLEKLRHSDHQAIKLLHHEGYHTHRDWEAKNSILLTWQISFDHIRRTRQSAADLLSLMSFFDRQGIPEDLLRVQGKGKTNRSSGSLGEIANTSSGEDTDSSSEDDLEDGFENDIATLRDYSFIATCEDSMMFTMHRLANMKLGRDAGPCFHMLGRPFYIGRNRKTHSEVGLRYSTGGAWYAIKCGSISVAEDFAAMSRKQRMKIGGAEDKDTLNSTTILAEAYRIEGRWEEAEQLQVQVMETRKTKLGVDHPDTLSSMANLASTYSNQGRWEEAEQLQVQVMETSKTKLGVDHPDTLSSIANLASTYWNQGRWKEAEQLQVQVIETRKTKLGVDHPSTLSSMANLASTYWNQGRWEEAEQLQVQVMETRKTKLGVDHPDTLSSMANLASTYSNQGRWEEAEQLQVQVMETSKTKLGVDHPSTLTSMANLASTYSNQGRWEEAEQLEIQVMETRKTKLGVDHPDTLSSMANLASTY
ncbi:uncharacterized protein N7487_000526 [Penicillium crustosum]|nr:uncharacterized protein N7487_000526 [Penicillium crustosum]KAJ5416976.1 hypothetical protein N7487_000526 [Penicillium crustosum]